MFLGVEWDLTKLLLVAGWLAGWVLLFKAPTLPRRRPDRAAGPLQEPITIVTPARNEAVSLPRILDSLSKNRPEHARVIVVDDHSEDATGDIARAFDFVDVIDAPPLPKEWIGKTWACHVGAETAAPGTLVFVDADVRVHDDAVAHAVRHQQEHCDLLTVFPRHMVEKPYEHLSAMFGTMTVMALGAGSILKPRRPRGGFGPFMVTSTEAYAAVGGHAAVKGEVIDDMALAQNYSAAGRRVLNVVGGADIHFRMYPDGFRSLLDGWSKNVGSAFFTLTLWRVALMVFWATMAVGTLKWGGGLGKALPTAMYGLYAAQIFVMGRWLGNFGLLTALLYPFHILFALLVLVRSAFRTYVLGRVTWRGREVPTSWSVSRDS